MSEFFAGLVLLGVVALLVRPTASRGAWGKRVLKGPLEDPDDLVSLTPPPLELLQRGGPWP